MIVVQESMDTKIQQLAYQLFQYLTTRELKGKRIPDLTSLARRKHANGYYLGFREFAEAVKNYTSGYRRAMEIDEKKTNIDCALDVYDRVINCLDKI